MSEKKTLGERIGYPGAGKKKKPEPEGPSMWDRLKSSLLTESKEPAVAQPAPSPSADRGPWIDLEEAKKFEDGFFKRDKPKK